MLRKIFGRQNLTNFVDMILYRHLRKSKVIFAAL